MHEARIIVLTNDDGMDAPGLNAAYDAVREMGRVVVAAPCSERSACSHAITLRRPITVERVSHAQYGEAFVVDGTPADCVRLACAQLAGGPVDLVVSGINCGANAGIDVFYSGTIAAAREAAILGIRGIAVSQAIRGAATADWDAATRVATRLVAELEAEPLPAPGFWSVNLPMPIPADFASHVHRVPVASHPLPLEFHRATQNNGRVMQFTYAAAYWRREEDGPNDYTVLRDGGIAVSAVPLYGRF
ncbi:MAG: 5'/3'-nucleotidase SurE [Planctomycetes bacterium]|nr:5'/3'-nucleotidase SurE [Planctomycetota bacterium]